MISLDEARELVRQRLQKNEAITIGLAEACGYVLAEDVASRADSPPFAKAMVDGYAVISADLNRGAAILQVVETVFAGQVPCRAITSGEATRIMTGAIVPVGADAVVKVEETQLADATGGRVAISTAPTQTGQHVLRQGAIFPAGQVLVHAGRCLRPVEIGLLAEIGLAQVAVVRRPRVAVIATGDELVPAGQAVGLGQIHNSNGPMLTAMARQSGGEPLDLGIIADDESALRRAIDRGLLADVLVISGGVSQGDRDLVPGILHQAGVERIFHRIQLRPGQPLWFGICGQADRATLVFGLPGNPVSGLVCFRLFVAPALRWLAGRESAWNGTGETARLSEPFVLQGGRPAYWPGACHRGVDGTSQVSALPWQGSADLFTLCQANCLICFPEGNRTYLAGEPLSLVPLE